MDVLAHGLWGGSLFGNRNQRHWRWAFLLGTAPDVIALGPFTAWQMLISGSAEFPPYVYATYYVTHSLVVWAVIAGAIWLFRSEFLWIWCAWGLHVLCDIPLHETSFFPTPYLWPFKTPLVNGVHWGQLWLIALNWAALVITYASYVVRKHDYGLWDEPYKSSVPTIFIDHPEKPDANSSVVKGTSYPGAWAVVDSSLANSISLLDS